VTQRTLAAISLVSRYGT